MLQTSLARALLAIKGYTSEVEEAYHRALQLSEGQGEIPQLFPVLRGLSSYYMYRAEFDKGAQIGKRILKLAESKDDDVLRVHGYLVLGANTGLLQDFGAGLEILDKGIAVFEHQPRDFRPFQLGNNPGIVCYTTSAFYLYWLGYPDQAVKRADRAIELAQELNHPFTMAYALFHTGNLHLWRGETRLAEDRAQAMLEIAMEHGFQIWEALATILLGSAQMRQAETGAGFEKIEQGFASYQGHKSPPVFYPHIIAMRAAAYAQAGRPKEGLELLNGLLEGMELERLMREMPQAFLIMGDLLLAISPQNQAEAVSIFREVLAGKGHAEDRMTRLQAATRLCRLEGMDGAAGESCRILAEIYAGFTEGFDTYDLQAARAVLAQ
jgi:tetratricopeptide (TPR) repeat protein